jgi:hypothetical protein
MTDWHDNFQRFAAAVADRLEAGASTYGDRSFSLDLVSLLGEIDQELHDVCGWSFIAHTRIEKLLEVADELERPPALELGITDLGVVADALKLALPRLEPFPLRRQIASKLLERVESALRRAVTPGGRDGR